MKITTNAAISLAVGWARHHLVPPLLAGTLLYIVLPVQAAAVGDPLSLETAVERAQRNDPWLAGSRHQQQMLVSRAVAASTLPDPWVSLSAMNLPTDSLAFNQEPMTQIRVGISQMFARGDSLSLRHKKFQLLSRQQPFLRRERRAQVAVTVAGLWLDVYRAQESIRLIERDRPLFEQLVDIAQASYATVVGGARQQDMVRSQLELTRLEDRLTLLHQQREVAQRHLSRWIGEQFIDQYGAGEQTRAGPGQSMLPATVTRHLPQQVLLPANLMTKQSIPAQELADYFRKHPSLLALDSRIQASRTEITLARQKYKPRWGVNASYGYRATDSAGRNRADLITLGLSFDVPLFTGNRQDKEVQAAVAQAASVTTQKWLLLRRMIAGFEAWRVQLQRLEQRYQLYQQQLLPQMQVQAQVALTAYTNDEGDFAEVVRARIAVLNARIDDLGIAVDRQKVIAQINYYFVSSAAAVEQARYGGAA